MLNWFAKKQNSESSSSSPSISSNSSKFQKHIEHVNEHEHNQLTITDNASNYIPKENSNESSEGEEQISTPLEVQIQQPQQKEKSKKPISSKNKKKNQNVKKIQRKKIPELQKRRILRLCKNFQKHNLPNQKPYKFRTTAVALLRDIIEAKLMSVIHIAAAETSMNNRKTLMPEYLKKAIYEENRNSNYWTISDREKIELQFIE